MNRPEHEDQTAPPESDPGSKPASAGPESGGSDAANTYIDHVRKVIMQPDEYFHRDNGASLGLGLINLGVFLGITFVYIFMAQVTRFSSWTFKFGHITSGLRSVLAIGIPLVVATYALRWLAGRNDSPARSTGFFAEKVGAILILPSLLLAAALILRIVDFNLYSWFRNVEMTMVYVGIFLLCYLHTTRNRIATAAVFTIGFYFAYRLVLLLL